MDDFPLPYWLQRMPTGPQKDRATNKFYLKLAVLYAHPDGKIGDLAYIIGINPATLKSQVTSVRCVASRKTKEGIRKLLGPQFVPPDLPDGRKVRNYRRTG